MQGCCESCLVVLLVEQLHRRLALLVGDDWVGVGLDQVLHDQIVRVCRSYVQRGALLLLRLLVDVLAFTDNDPDLVKVSILACLPDIYKILKINQNTYF